MRVFVEHNHVTLRVNIYITEHDSYLVYKEAMHYDRIPYKWGEQIEPFISLDRMLFEEIIKEAMQEVHPDNATYDALKDTRVVRDRLLTMIEKQVGATSPSRR